ncbi:MAG TPA: FtsX-like permease family protein, partial [Ktedonobacterales bacterium]
SSEALALPTENLVTLWPAFAAALGALVVVVLTAALPALRSGALSPVEALARGTAPRAHRRSRLTGILQRLRVPRILSLGAGDAFVRPVRGLLTTVAVVIGVATLTFGFGLHSSLQRLASKQWLNPDILVTRFGSYPDADLSRTLQARPESAIVVAYTFTAVSVAGDSTPINAIPMRGDSGQLDFQLLQGRWFTGPGEVVSGSAFVKEAHLKIGDMVTVTGTSQSVPLRLVGVYFDTDNFSRVIRFDWASYLQMSQDAQPSMYQVTLRPGADPAAYARDVLASAPDFLSVQARQSSVSPILGALDSVLAVLAVVLSVIAIAGVFNTLLLSTRERARELATLKTVGMTPGQVVGMVVSSAVAYGVIGGIVGIVAGIWLHGALLSLMGQVINDPLPSAIAQNVFGVVTLLALVLIGVLVAVAGASLPAWLAARTRIVQVLHAE